MDQIVELQHKFSYVKQTAEDRRLSSPFPDCYPGVYLPLDGPPEKILIKIIRDVSRQRLTLFISEVESMARLNHPACLPLLACNFDPHGPPSLVLPRLAMTLEDIIVRLQKGFCPSFWTPTVKSVIAIGLASALLHCHSKGIVHCYVKPSSIYLDAHYRPLLSDFMLSGNVFDSGRTNPRCTFANRHISDSFYHSPEVISDEGPPTAAVDVFSYGMVLYAIMTGHCPFSRCTRFTFASRICAGERPLIPDSVNCELRDLILNCWDHNPSIRPTFGEIQEHRDLLMVEGSDRDELAEYERELGLSISIVIPGQVRTVDYEFH
jgi:serine/threonine protein kinase